jgi:IclR family transcriptional regulator, pca regulon regulatory protein
MTADRNRYLISSLSRGLSVLRVFDGVRGPLPLTEIARRVDLPLSTVFRIALTLEAEGFLDRTDERTFCVGPSVLRLGMAAIDEMTVLRAAGAHLRTLARRTNETVNVGILDGIQVLYLDRVRNAELVTADVEVGSVLPAVRTSMGKVLLANLSQEASARRMPQLDFSIGGGPRAIRSPDVFAEQLRLVREQGWATQDEELAYGLRSVAAPIHSNSLVVAALNLAVPATKWTLDELIERFLPDVLETARTISAALQRLPPQKLPPQDRLADIPDSSDPAG